MGINMRDVSVATFNLLNLHVPGGLTYSDTPSIPDTAEGRVEYETRLAWLGQKIRVLDADIIGFQELWSKKALEDVFEASGMADDYVLIARDAPGKYKPQVAAAVRKDRHGDSIVVGDPEWIADFMPSFNLDGVRESHGAEEEIQVSINKFSRPILNFKVQPEGRSKKPPEVEFFVAHLKSKGGTKLREVVRGSETILDHHYGLASSAVSHTRRILEAGALRALLDDRMASTDERILSPVVVLGDLNDGTTSTSTELITGQPGYRLMAKSTAGATADKGLYTVEALQQYRSQRHVYYTYIYKNKMESLDHILVSEEFYDHSKKRQWSFKEMEVINDHLNASQKKRLEELGGSDHGIVRAYFDWNPIEDEIEKIVEEATEDPLT